MRNNCFVEVNNSIDHDFTVNSQNLSSVWIDFALSQNRLSEEFINRLINTFSIVNECLLDECEQLFTLKELTIFCNFINGSMIGDKNALTRKLNNLPMELVDAVESGFIPFVSTEDEYQVVESLVTKICDYTMSQRATLIFFYSALRSLKIRSTEHKLTRLVWRNSNEVL